MHKCVSLTRYGAVARGFHWFTAVLVICAYLFSEGGPEARVYSDAFDSARRLHETLGLATFAVVMLRLIWRLFDHRPAEPPMPTWMALAARAAHFALHVLLIAVPVTAVVGAWCEGHPVTLLGASNINSWVLPSHDLGRTIIEIHSTLGNVILWVAGLHAAAALFHHFVLKDAVLTSMLPAPPSRRFNLSRSEPSPETRGGDPRRPSARHARTDLSRLSTCRRIVMAGLCHRVTRLMRVFVQADWFRPRMRGNSGRERDRVRRGPAEL